MHKDNDDNFRKVLNESLKIFFKDALRISVKRPSQAYFFYQTIRWQQKAARRRLQWEENGVHVPPIMIFSVTQRCNLHCKGCYAQAINRSSSEEMSEAKIRKVIQEARDLGISFMVIAGGEPFVRKEIVDIMKDFPEIIFLVFTNGLLIDDELLMKLRKQKNVVPLISLEGYADATNERRGQGVYERLQRIITKVKNKGIFFGTSLTITRPTFDILTSRDFIHDLVNVGCKFFLFIEYTPVKEGTEDWLLTDGQRDRIMQLMHSFRTKWPALFIAVPGDEEEIGGCLSAGRGFIHVSADGDVEPCPFAPYSDVNLKHVSLREALQSEFLKAIRDNQGEIHETEGGCALWVKRKWVQSLLHKTVTRAPKQNVVLCE
ncbi:MAG: radical SAM protein [candidate division WOR-3 bacterium]|nr:MAG: radical SAM protein [candidate division WOR-3 bacterium]